MNKVYVVGVGMTKFEKPETRQWRYFDMAREAGSAALADAGVGYEQIEQVAAGYVFGPSTCGQRAAYELGLTGVPVYNVNNNCATGSTALMMAAQWIRGGLNECVLALGFEQMKKGSLGGGMNNDDFAASPLARHYTLMAELHPFEASPPASTWSATAPPPSSWRWSPRRTTGIRSTTPTRNSRTSTRSRTCWKHERSTAR